SHVILRTSRSTLLPYTTLFRSFIRRQAKNMGGEVFVDEQALAPGFRMRAHHRMNGWLHLGNLLGRQGGTANAGEYLIIVTGQVRMCGALARQSLLHLLGQRFVSGLLRGKQGITALGR